MKIVRITVALRFAASYMMGQNRRLGPTDGLNLPSADLEKDDGVLKMLLEFEL